MILTVLEYAAKFPCKGKTLSRQAVISRCIKGFLPSGHHARQLPCGDNESKKGVWVIEVPDEATKEIIATKIDPMKPDIRTINSRYFSFR
jgi:hypothetical protein